jgi:membrane dipeptidase
MRKPLLLVDSHLDLAFNAIQLKRDLTASVASVRAHDPEPLARSFGTCTVTFPELRKGGLGLVFGTVMTRIDPNDSWTATGMYAQSQCYGIGMGHLAYYQALEREGVLRFVGNVEELDRHLADWEQSGGSGPIGLVLAMEGADSILGPEQVPEWYEAGLRMVSISHYGVSSYAHGTGTEGGLLPRAKPLLEAFKAHGIILDLTHLADQAFWEALEAFDGRVAASHHNCRSLVPGQRQLSDEMIKAIVERDGVIGVALDAWMLDPQWQPEVPACDQLAHVTLEAVADHVDHIAQLAGSARHCGIGSDLDGAYGQEQAPRDIDTIADLQKLAGILEKRGYCSSDVQNIFSGNWIRALKEAWRESGLGVPADVEA